MTDAVTLHKLIVAHQWTAVVAVLLVVAVACWRKAQPLVWDKLPKWARYAIPMFVVGASAVAESLQRGDSWGLTAVTGLVSVWATIGGVKTAGLLVKAPPAAANAVLFVVASWTAYACTSQQLRVAQDIRGQAANACEFQILVFVAPLLLTDAQAREALRVTRVACAAVDSDCAKDAASGFRDEQLKLQEAQRAREQTEAVDAGVQTEQPQPEAGQ